MFSWLWKKLTGQHICEEFTQWETHKGLYSRVADYTDGAVALRRGIVEFTRRWQERQCTICGRIEQRELKQ